MKLKLLIFIITSLLLFACGEKEDLINVVVREQDSSIKETQHPIIIDFQPFSDIPDKYTAYVYQQLAKIYPHLKLKKTIPLPQRAFYAKRNRYRADTLINYLRQQTPDGHVTIGMTSKDISDTKGEVADYGIMGLGYQPGKSCVVSYFRLSKENVLEQFFKLSIHELGHTQGLPHCLEKTCFMRDAEGKNHANEEKEFCPKCKAHLISKGWIFK